MKADNGQPIKFQLVNITTKQFAFLQEFFKPDVIATDISIGSKFGVDIEKNIVVNHINIKLIQEEKPYLILEIANFYKIAPDYWKKFMPKDGKVVISKIFATHLAMITIGTIRGVLYEKSQNLPDFKTPILPLLNVQDLIKTDVRVVTE